jgi:hypothetical protein
MLFGSLLVLLESVYFLHTDTADENHLGENILASYKLLFPNDLTASRIADLLFKVGPATFS